MHPIKLSIDCSSQSASFILSDASGNAITDLIIDKSDSLLFKRLPETFNQFDVTTKDIAMIAWGQGPGSFTGIRICATWIQSLSYIHQLSVLPICSLRARAQEYCHKNNVSNGQLSAYLTANRQFVYKGVWQLDNGFVCASNDLSIVNKDQLDQSCFNLDEYNASAYEIDFLSKSVENDKRLLTNSFDIRPNYLFDQFN